MRLASSRIHPDRVARRDRDHRGPDRAALARRAIGREAARRAQCTNNLKQIGLALHNYHTGMDRFPMAVSKNPLWGPGDTDGQWGYGRWTGWSAQALLLGYIDQMPLYNAANFSLGPGAGGGMIGSLPNSTLYNSVVNSFLCPSDPNAGFDRSNSYHASIGSTTYESPIHTPGLFAVWTCYGIRDCTDGSSNTIAFAEALAGSNNSGFGYGSQINASSGTAYRGDVVENANNPGTGGQGADDPSGYYGTSAQFLMASANSAAVLAGLQACATAWSNPATASYSTMRGFNWSDGNGGWTYTNIIQTPNRDPAFLGGGCRFNCRRLRHRQLVQLRGLEQSPGWGQYPDGRRQRAVHQGQRAIGSPGGPSAPVTAARSSAPTVIDLPDRSGGAAGAPRRASGTQENR